MRLFVGRVAFLFAFLLAWSLVWPHSCLAKEIKVELVWKYGRSGWIEVQIEEGLYELRNSTQSRQLSPGSTIQLGWGGWAPVIRVNHEDFRNLSKDSLAVVSLGTGSFQIKTPDGKHAFYRGSLLISWQGDHWRLLNQVEEEDYLKGVVPIEMSNQWAKSGMEALKAQSVAARTFMVKHTQNDQVITDSPDIDQAYAGKDVEGEASVAVEMTAGEILVDSQSKQPIDAFYSSHNGGYSEDARNVWGNSDRHYSSHPDPYSPGVGGAEDRWRFIIAAEVLGKTFGLGPVRKIELDKLPSGRVKKVRMEDWLGNSQTISGRAFVKAFYPFGQPIQAQAFLGNLFDEKFVGTEKPREILSFRVGKSMEDLANNQVGGGPLLGRIISSAQGVSPMIQPYGIFIFEGRGWGHGVGMSQWGAYHMAQLGYSYREILSFYYDNVVITTR